MMNPMMRMMKLRVVLYNRQMAYIKARRGNHFVYLFKRGLSTRIVFFSRIVIQNISKANSAEDKQ